MSDSFISDISEHYRARTAELLAKGKSDHTIAQELNIKRHQARKLIEEVRLQQARAEQRGEVIEVDPEPETIPEFVEAISKCLRKSVEGVIEAGRHLINARIRHSGEFTSMVERDLGMTPRTAQRLMAIARDERFATYRSHLPTTWRTLFELTRLDDDEFAEAVEAGAIHPNMSQNDAIRLKNPAASSAPDGGVHEPAASAQPADARALPQQMTEDRGQRTDESEVMPSGNVGRSAGLRGVLRSETEKSEIWQRDAPPRPGQSDQGGAEESRPVNVLALSETEQRKLVAVMDDKVVLEAAKQLRAKRLESRREEKLEKLRNIGAAGPIPWTSDKLYGVIYADPPWRFSVYSEETGREKSPENHYPTMSDEEICALAPDIWKIRSLDAVLFLWATVPKLPAALAVMSEWGFDYKSHLIWDKQRTGTGYWVRNRHELLLIGTYGNIPAPKAGTQFPSIRSFPAGPHSAKPREFAEMIEAMFPGVPSIELFARRPANERWDVWGNQAVINAVGEEAEEHAERPPRISRAVTEMPDIPVFLDRRTEQTEGTH